MNRLFLLAALVAAPALAQGPAADSVQRVRVADLDLTRAADVHMLDRRLRAAVQQVCGTVSAADPEGRNEARRCRAATSARVAAQRQDAIASAARPADLALASGR